MTNIRRAQEKDLTSLLKLLSEVLEIHASIRPDIFISGSTKYTDAELIEKMKDDTKPIFVCVNDADEVLGYAFCVFKTREKTNNMKPKQYLYIDDLCVDSAARGMHVGESLLTYVENFAKENGCEELTLTVWEGNDSAKGFYEHVGFKTRVTTLEYKL